MGRKKAGMCKCGHELRRFHDDAGVCTYGAGTLFAGSCERDYGGPCSKPRRKKMNGTTKTTTHTVTVDGDGVLAAFDALIKAHEIGLHALRNLRAALLAGRTKTSGEGRSGLMADFPTVEKQTAPQTTRERDAVATPSRRAEVPKSAAPERGDDALGAGPLAVLTAIAQWGDPTPEVLIVATGYRSTSVQTYLGELSSRALITREHGRSQLTLDGAATVSDPLPPRPTKKELLERWIADLSEGPSVVLRAIAESPDATATPTQLVDVTPYKHTSIQTYLGELASAKVIKRGGGRARLHPELGGPR